MDSVFETIKNRLPIAEVLSRYITLIPSGKQLKAKCPFHTERSASFSVSPERGLYYCFGCGAKGDIFTFVEHFEGVDRKGALKILAQRAGVELKSGFLPKENLDSLFEALERTTLEYQRQLSLHPEILAYLKERGINDKTIEDFRIGYAPDEWRFVVDKFKESIDLKKLERAGLIIKTEKGHYDRFRKRIMFPINDSSGRIVGFSGRSYPVDDKSPKYLNSAENELFQKSRLLFGFDKAKFAIRKHDFAILVEGQIDCVLSHQFGFKNTVASSGTAVSEMSASDPTSNLAVVSRLTQNIFLAFDGDTAGQKALKNAALVALSLGMNPKVVALPEGLDPADYLNQKGAEAWKKMLQKSEHFILYQLHSIDSQNPSAHVLVQEMKQKVFPFVVKVLSPLERDLYLEMIAKELSLSKEVVNRELNLFEQNNMIASETRPAMSSINSEITLQERFEALINLYPNEHNQNLKKELLVLSFEDQKFTPELIDLERSSQALAIMERDIGYLDQAEKDLLASELFSQIKNQFFNQVNYIYSKILQEAEHKNEEELVRETLSKLESLNQLRHGQT